ncbi:MAG: lipase family protein [Thermoanaerobaculia bacterium]|nr:MAG: lipase family protein [Thermoanaerobaculia bacterium]
MNVERMCIEKPAPPFPLYADPVGDLLRAHHADAAERDATAAHLLGVCAAYAYADTRTVATLMSRLGLADGACVRVEQTVDAMFVFSTAYLVQSRCGRVVLLAYRGTEPTNLASWIGDADVGPEPMPVEGEPLAVHSGFRRNLGATRLGVLAELHLALEGRSLLDPERTVDHPLDALYVTGHSLGGAMAALFALSLGPAERAVAERLRAIYTFGQPLATAVPLPAAAHRVGRRLFRHVLPRDPIPALPLASWGRLGHLGQEYRWLDGEWRRSATAVVQIASARRLSPSVLAFFLSARRRAAARYSLAEHVPHRYLEALRPPGRVTELGDPG